MIKFIGMNSEFQIINIHFFTDSFCFQALVTKFQTYEYSKSKTIKQRFNIIKNQSEIADMSALSQET